jgi:hypothetical protein
MSNEQIVAAETQETAIECPTQASSWDEPGEYMIGDSIPPDDSQPPFDVDAWRLRIVELAKRENDVKWEIGDCLV